MTTSWPTIEAKVRRGERLTPPEGVFLLAEAPLTELGALANDVRAKKTDPRLVTYVIVCIAWVFFRAPNFEGAAMLLGAMAGKIPVGQAILSGREILQVVLVIFGLWLIQWRLRDTSLEAAITRLPVWLVGATWTLMLGAIILTQGSGNAFIYFQF